MLASSDYRKSLRRAGVAAAIEHEPVLKSMQFNTIVDIGANRGQFALAARHCNPQARIIAFEPLAEPANKFRAILAADPLIVLHPVAIGPTASSANMHVTAEDDSSSLLPITELQQSLFSGTNEVATETIQIEPLTLRISPADLQAPALLKIDVQGYELPVLQGCQPLLDHFAYLYVECSFVELYHGQALAPEVVEYLRQQGFGLSGVYNVQYDGAGRAIQADMLFAPATR